MWRVDGLTVGCPTLVWCLRPPWSQPKTLLGLTPGIDSTVPKLLEPSSLKWLSLKTVFLLAMAWLRE